MAEPSASAGSPASQSSPAPADMRFPLRSVLIFFLALIPVYGVVFWGTEYLRGKDGPWRLVFASDAAGEPSLMVEHAGILAGGVEIRFSGEKIAPSTRVECILDKPGKPLPWGTRISEDITFLPGTLAMDMFGHEVEIAPRVMVINRKEIAWGSQMRVQLTADQKLPASERYSAKPAKAPVKPAR